MSNIYNELYGRKRIYHTKIQESNESLEQARDRAGREHFLKEKLLHELGKGVSNHATVTNYSDELTNSHVYEGSVVILSESEYRSMMLELGHYEQLKKILSDRVKSDE